LPVSAQQAANQPARVVLSQFLSGKQPGVSSFVGRDLRRTGQLAAVDDDHATGTFEPSAIDRGVEALGAAYAALR
jgi:hypothetical protein